MRSSAVVLRLVHAFPLVKLVNYFPDSEFTIVNSLHNVFKREPYWGSHVFLPVRVFISKTIQQVLVKDFCLLECDAASLDKWFSTFRKNVPPSSSRCQGLKHGHREQLAQRRSFTPPKTEILYYTAVKSLKHIRFDYIWYWRCTRKISTRTWL
jgi:hypothetical protein